MQAFHKAEKAKALKKAKVEKTKLRQEKLARRNPDRIARQISDLKALEEASGGELKPHDRKVLAELEKELVAVKKAREVLGVKDEERGVGGAGRGRGGGERGRGADGRGGGRGGAGGRGAGGMGMGASGANAMRVDGRRGRADRGDESDSGESTASSVRDIPMPSGTPPPPPRRRRTSPPAGTPTQPHALPPKPVLPTPVTTYSAAPIVRDLRKEAAAFVPAAVQRKLLATGKSGGGGDGTQGVDTQDGKEDNTPAAGLNDGGSQQTPKSQPMPQLQTQGFAATTVVNAAPEIGGAPVQADVDEEYERFQREMNMEVDTTGEGEGGGDGV